MASDRVSTPPDPLDRARRRGARVAIAIFGVIVSAITALWAGQIIQQVWFPRPSASAALCRPGIQGLIDSVRRARAAADAETGGERAAVARFRKALEPEWDSREALSSACHGDPLAERALRDVDRLRYAEEHATRYEAVDLAARRRDIQTVERDLSRR
jgi:hypothetical protein